jgi:hypothetical protein
MKCNGAITDRLCVWALWLSVFVVAESASLDAQVFPEWRVIGYRAIDYIWDQSPIILVGELGEVREVGVQILKKTPNASELPVTRVYWCQANLHVSHVVRGLGSSETRKWLYMWGSIFPGCQLGHNAIAKSRNEVRVWFLRREGSLMRPLYDSGAYNYDALQVSEGGRAFQVTNERLGRMYLDPQSYANKKDDMRDTMFSIGHIACSLLGRPSCVQELNTLRRKEPELNQIICKYLQVTYNMSCPNPSVK